MITRPGHGIFAGTPDGVYRTIDEGERWKAFDQGLTVYEIYALCIGSDGCLYAGTSGGGVYRLPLENILSVQLSSFSIAQAAGGNVELRWVASSDVDNYGFEVQRRSFRAYIAFAMASCRHIAPTSDKIFLRSQKSVDIRLTES